MLILLDENLPLELAAELSGHDVRSVRDMAWRGKRNGELLALMRDSDIEFFVTVDQSLRFQQPIDRFPTGIIQLFARSNNITHLRPLMPSVRAYRADGQFEKLKEIRA